MSLQRSAGQQVAARKYRGNRLHLNRRRNGVTVFGNRTQQRIGQPECRKGHDNFRMGARPFALKGAASHSQTGETTEVEIDCGKGLEQRAATALYTTSNRLGDQGDSLHRALCFTHGSGGSGLTRISTASGNGKE